MVKDSKIKKIGHKDRYEFMCAVDAYIKYHVPITDDVIGGGDRPMTSTSYNSLY